MRVQRDVVYRTVLGFRPLALDWYLPDDPVATIVYVHGGGWRRGSRRRELLDGLYERITDAGYAVATVDYRLSGEATFPAPLEDLRAAIEFVRSGPVYLWGESAGGHLALLAGLDGMSTVDGVVAWFPVTDLLGLPADLGVASEPDSREAGLLGVTPESAPELARAASPLTYAHQDAPPVLLVHGDSDELVPSAQSVRLADALRTVGAPVDLEIVPGAGHGWTGASDTDAIVDRSLTFLRSPSLR